ncbi:MAG: D-alanyl-D-alanine carboxypeptidase, partial [Gaiellales bacterium]
MRKVRVLPIALVAACLAALVVPVLASSASTARPLPARLARALAPAEADGTTTGAIVIDVETLEVLYARNADRGFVPASTEKLPVALTALEVLGPGFRAQTVV